jgi:hypothetical protein
MPKKYGGSGYIDPHSIDLGTSWEWSALRLGHLTPGERAPCTHWIGGCVSPRTGLDDVGTGEGTRDTSLNQKEQT